MGLNTVGMSRRGMSREEIDIIHEVYKYLYMSDLNVSNALKLIEERIAPCVLRDEIVDFVVNSGRGVIRSAF